jgi:hypothetical protein
MAGGGRSGRGRAVLQRPPRRAALLLRGRWRAVLLRGRGVLLCSLGERWGGAAMRPRRETQ